jgi:pantoate kinase
MSPTDPSSTTAYAPGSVTMIFAPPTEPEDGSLGMSFAIEDGVEATVESGSSTVISLDGKSTAFEPVEIALRQLDVTATVSLMSAVPVGYGFGASGAATLATVLAANETFNLGKSREELVEVAHHAEIEAGTGLGDVFIQARGGLVWNDGNGVQRTEMTAPLEYTALAGIATDEVLADDRTLERIREAGQDSLSRFSPEKSLRDLLTLSWNFAQQTGLATERVAGEVQRAKRAGGAAGMAMVGETVIATDVHDLFERSTRITNHGARIQQAPPE